ncbi:hypothetical protein V8E36_005133 [Tilletia maclaganii]
MGISAVALNSDTIGRGKIRFRRTSKSSLDPIQKIHRGKAQVVFAAPETLISNAVVSKAVCESIWTKKLAAIFGDEAHIIHAWGVASSSGRVPFRPAYGKLSTLRARFSCHVPMIAVSATLVGNYLPSVCSSFSYGIRPFFAMGVGKERDGCVYDVQTFQHHANSFIDLLEMLPTDAHALAHLPKMFVYVNSRVKATMAAEALRNHFPHHLRKAVESFTAGDGSHHKRGIMRKLRAGEIRIVVATEALGMGIDLPDVDMVIQWQMPKDFTELVQHLGRAARGPALLLCDSWIDQVRPILRASTAASSNTPARKELLDRWFALDRPLREWLACEGCLQTKLAELLRLDWSVLPHNIDDTAATPISEPLPTQTVAHDVSSASSSGRYYWTSPAPSTAAATTTTETMTPECCSRCNASNSVPRQPFLAQAARAPARLAAPPLHKDSLELRRDLMVTLTDWRREKWQQAKDVHHWQSERAIVDDPFIEGLIDRAPRILAHARDKGLAAINHAYLIQLIGESSSLRSADFLEMQSLLQSWANSHLASEIASILSPAGRVPKGSSVVFTVLAIKCFSGRIVTGRLRRVQQECVVLLRGVAKILPPRQALLS